MLLKTLSLIIVYDRWFYGQIYRKSYFDIVDI